MTQEPEVWLAVIGVVGMLVRALVDLQIIRSEIKKLVGVQNVMASRLDDLGSRVNKLEAAAK